jgi:hypothetical protein
MIPIDLPIAANLASHSLGARALLPIVNTMGHLRRRVLIRCDFDFGAPSAGIPLQCENPKWLWLAKG